MGLLPVERRQLTDFLVGGTGQTLQHVFEVGVRFDAVAAAVFDQSIDDRAALAGFFRTEEEPVLLANGRGPDGVLDEVMPPPVLCRVAG